MEAVDRRSIEDLLHKYFEAETTIEEERQLKAYFRSGSVDPVFSEYRDLFALASSEQSLTIPSGDFESRVMKEIGRPKVIRLSVRRVLAIAASITLVILAGWWALQNREDSQAEDVVMEDTYDDPEEAYRQVTEALALMSTTMQKGQQMTIQSVAPVQELDVFQLN